uniref:Secreted protein n=1 Tax=Romanomermis culicivorax TaxID=13658 RepID=A0A915JT91_ROMCU
MIQQKFKYVTNALLLYVSIILLISVQYENSCLLLQILITKKTGSTTIESEKRDENVDSQRSIISTITHRRTHAWNAYCYIHIIANFKFHLLQSFTVVYASSTTDGSANVSAQLTEGHGQEDGGRGDSFRQTG